MSENQDGFRICDQEEAAREEAYCKEALRAVWVALLETHVIMSWFEEGGQLEVKE